MARQQQYYFIFAGILIALLGVANWSVLATTGKLLWQSDDMAHGFVAPFVALFITWMKWDQVKNLIGSGGGKLWGTLLLLLFAAASVLFTYGGSTSLARLSFLGSLVACLILLGGWNLLKTLAFPTFLLAFCFPIPNVLYGEMTQPLQLMAAALSEEIFELLGYATFREGNVIHLPHQVLNVAEACSGIRSLITLLFATTVYSYFFESTIWVRAALIVSSVPAAILMNTMRITLSGVLGKYDRSWVNGSYHDGLGWAALIMGFLLVLAIHKLLGRFAKGGKKSTANKTGYTMAPMGGAFRAAALTAIVVLGAQSFLLNAWSRKEFIPTIAPLSTIPSDFPEWSFVSEPPVEEAALEMLGPDDHLNRVYRFQKDQAPVSLFMAYYSTQHRAKNAHDPKVCLPGSGWNPVESAEAPMRLGDKTIQVNRYVVRKDGLANLVVYWFQLHDGTATKEQGLRWRRVFSTSLANRSDMALVRFVTSIRDGNVEDAWNRTAALANLTYPKITSFFPPNSAN